MRFFGLLLSVIFLGTFSAASAQNTGTWDSYPSLNGVRFIVEDGDGRLWVATDGGLYSLVDGEADAVFTRAEGLYQLNPTSMVYDPASDRIWMGYEDGMLESFSPETELFQRDDAVFRATQYVRRNISSIRVVGDRFYLATGFGVVVYDPARRIVLESYPNLGSFPSGTSVNDVTVNGTTIYAATSLGVAVGNMAQGDLANPSSWSNLSHQDFQGTRNVQSVAFFRDRLYASIGVSNFTYNGTSWEGLNFPSGPVQRFRLSASGNSLIAVASTYVRVITADGTIQTVDTGANTVRDFYFDDRSGQEILLGTLNQGLLQMQHFGDANPQSLTPTGPHMNFFSGLKVIDGVLISATSPNPGRFASALLSTGYSIYKEGTWTNRNRDTDQGMLVYDANSYYVSAGNKDYYFFGSWGDGIVMHNVQSDATEVFNFESGASINPSVSPSFIVVPGMDLDTRSNLWFPVFLGNPNALYQFNPQTKTFTGYPRSPLVPVTEYYFGLLVDSFDQKWLPIVDGSQNGRGLLVLDQGDLSNASDDLAVYLTQSLNNLPHNKVQAMIQDRRGEVWVGTAEGIARFLFPDRVIRGNSADRQAERLRIRNELTGDITFFLSRTPITSIAVNAANEKWIGTQGDGVYHVREDGGLVTILHHFTSANSPLPSSNIVSVAVDDATGTVYIATDIAMLSYNDVVKAGVAKMDELKVYPNPYVYDRNTGSIVIDGLSDQTRVHVLTVDGRLVRRLDVNGGRGSWDALDDSGRQLATGVYTIVAVQNDGSQKGVGKVVIVR